MESISCQLVERIKKYLRDFEVETRISARGLSSLRMEKKHKNVNYRKTTFQQFHVYLMFL